MKELIIFFKHCFILFFFIFQGCQVESVQVTQPPFFDLNTFFEKELEFLSNLKEINKTVILNGKKEEKTLNDFDLKKDLEIFTDSNINKVAWLDKYKVDSLTNVNGLLEKIIYQALDEKVKTRQLIIEYSSGEVKSISIKNASSNQVALLNQDLKYIPKKGYMILSSQEVSLSDEQKLSVEVEFVN